MPQLTGYVVQTTGKPLRYVTLRYVTLQVVIVTTAVTLTLRPSGKTGSRRGQTTLNRQLHELSCVKPNKNLFNFFLNNKY